MSKITEEEMITDFNGYECVINSELATLNEIAENTIPKEYNGIKNEYFKEVVDKIVVPMYGRKELQRNYKEIIKNIFQLLKLNMEEYCRQK